VARHHMAVIYGGGVNVGNKDLLMQMSVKPLEGSTGMWWSARAFIMYDGLRDSPLRGYVWR
jgi:hypothetical protein